MLHAKNKNPDSLAEHLQQLRKNAASFSQHHEEDYLLSSHSHSASGLLLRMAALVGMLVFWIGYFVVRPFTDSALIENSVLGLAVLCTVYNFLAERRGKKRQARLNDRIKVGVGALIMAHEDCFDESAETPWAGAVLVATDDPALEADPDRLLDIAARINEMRSGDPSAIPAELQPLCVWLNNDGKGDDGYPQRPLPAELTGGGKAWVQSVAISRDRMPDEVIDRPLLPFLWDPEDLHAVPENPPLEMWYWPEVDPLFYTSSEPDGDEGVA